jgi:threonine dehydrogenase-like Zn-dependent dehydrogenase
VTAAYFDTPDLTLNESGFTLLIRNVEGRHRVTACAICDSNLHIYDSMIPTMKHGDVLGHETMGGVVEVGAETTR